MAMNWKGLKVNRQGKLTDTDSPEIIQTCYMAKQNIDKLQKTNTQSNAVMIPLPEGEFNVIYADPPWKYDFSKSENRKIENHYPTIELEQIKNYQDGNGKFLTNLFAKNAVLYLWATGPKIQEALEVMKAWEFKYKTQMIWDKEKMGLGYWVRGQHELLLIGTKGKFSHSRKSQTTRSVYREKRGKHSKKPDYFYDLIEFYHPLGRYLELFARQIRKNWVCWGKDIN